MVEIDMDSARASITGVQKIFSSKNRRETNEKLYSDVYLKYARRFGMQSEKIIEIMMMHANVISNNASGMLPLFQITKPNPST